jgi:alkylation response protein AidB-like acyl-CoA dehydrogenase
METVGRYQPPVADIAFALDRLADLPGLSKRPDFADLDRETIQSLLVEFGRFVAEVLSPLDAVGDAEGSHHDPVSGEVRTPTGWRQAYAKYVDAGWGSVPFPSEHGGGGFPWLVAIAMQEMMTSANMAFSLCPMLTQGAIDMLLHHGSEEQQARYLTKMVSGEWTGTMNLTEPQAGSDVGALTTKAVPAGDGTWRITGQKIFITYGEHDLTDNIVHLVLARVPDAPAGTRGISCFIVPKYVVGDDGSLGERNQVRCLSIEHKLGIHASPTCVLEFDGATGYLIGEVNAGMRYMFTMMNGARLSVGLQGLSIGEAAYQQAYRYAIERRQGRPLGAQPGAAIVEHPDVRRMLLTMRSLNEAMRGLCYLNAEAVDLAKHGEDQAERAAQQELADLLTPITKSWCTDMGSEVASLALQVHGGMGYIEETGVAQRYRDVRISAIYEGTNGIQALDLVGRKLGIRDGSAVGDLLTRVESLDARLAAAGEPLATIREGLKEAVTGLRSSTHWMLETLATDGRRALAGASPYLRQWGTVLGGWLLAQQALAALPGAASDEYPAAKVSTARFYCEHLLPQAAGFGRAAVAGDATLYEPSEAALASR